jgi:single-stranded DNA-binding protein
MPTFAMVAGKIDGEVKVNQVGDQKLPVANFRVATEPGWYSVAAWRELSAKVPAPGSYVIVTGKLSSRSYDKDGQKHVAVEVVASTIEVIGAAAPAEDLFE